MRAGWRVVLVASALLAGLPQVLAQDLSAEEMAERLAPTTAASRSLSSAQTMDEGTARLIDSLTGLSRGLTVVERQKLAPVLANPDLPQLDLTIEFEFNSAEITPEATLVLVRLGTALTQENLAKSVFVLAGHTDAKGSPDYNQALSERRANSVKDFLVAAFNISPNSLISVGFGEEQLKNTLDPEAAENRRVTVVNVAH